MNPTIKDAIRNGRLVLLLGAGASLTSFDKNGKNLLDGWGLAKKLATEASMAYSDETLPVVYAATKRPLGDRLNRILEDLFKHSRPSNSYNTIAKYAWARIYTLNIDDAIENAFRKNSDQRINIRNKGDRISDRAPFFDELDIIKLNGNIERLSEGLVFSPQEYGAGSANPPLWYEELGRDYYRYTFLFIGTKLNEPLFYHQVERFRQASGASQSRSFVLTPSASPIDIGSLDAMNLGHVPGTFEDFAIWLTKEFPKSILPLDLAKASNPQLAFLTERPNSGSYVELFEHIIRVSQSDLASSTRGKASPHRIRDFYRGFKPTWTEILDQVPAKLDIVNRVVERLLQSINPERLFVLYGPAGSGKSTALMQIALELSGRTKHPVYFLSAPIKGIRELLRALEESSAGPYYLFIDRISPIADSMLEAFKLERIVNGTVIASERQNVWLSRLSSALGGYTTGTFQIDQINRQEARAILSKLENYGPWHRLSKLRVTDRENEILNRSQRQLLIGLLEATAGHGFDQIIDKDFKELHDEDSRRFVVLVGLGTIHRLDLPEAIVSRALKSLGISTGVPRLLDLTSGIVRRVGDSLTARHPVYIERLFDLVVSKEEKAAAIHALLQAYSVYPRPLMKSVGRVAGSIFKLTVNHSFLKNTFRGDKDLVLAVYEAFAKAFQDDGLFWLHFGLALRDADRDYEALEKLKIAKETYRLRQSEHAYAQQLLILASDGHSRTMSMAYLHEAKQILEELDKESFELEGDDSDYPIVTLSEHHTQIILTLDGIEPAKAIAKYYSNLLGVRRKDNPNNHRLKQAWKMLTGFATGATPASELFIRK